MASEYFKAYLLVKVLLEHIEHSVRTIQERTSSIKSSNDFLSTPNGMEKLDAVCMQLIAIGEAVAKIDKINPEILTTEPDIPWKAIKNVRNVIAHDYFDIDEEEIFRIIQFDLQPLLSSVLRMKDSLQSN